MKSPSTDQGALSVVHVLRAPLGGLFRHVVDLTREQIARGHRVGIVTDSSTGGARADAVLDELAPDLALGLLRLPMQRNPGPHDIANARRIAAHCRMLAPDVVHGHGSKGGLYARLPGVLPFIDAGGAVRAYTPHGGSFNYQPGSALHRVYMGVERMLARATDILLFESAYIQTCFHRYVGEPRGLERVVRNGVSDAEFEPVTADADAADYLYVGELRAAKGIDTLIDALAELATRIGRAPRAVLVGSGPDQDALTAQARARGLADSISFPGPMGAREAFRRGEVLLIPSRAESLPYVVLEAAAARVPMVATNVGGIPEIFGPCARRLIPCNDVKRLADEMQRVHDMPRAQRDEEAERIGAYVQSHFKIADMTDAVLAGYRDALRRKHGQAATVGATASIHS